MKSIKLKVLIPVVILSLLAIISSYLSMNNAKKLYLDAEAIALEEMEASQQVGEIAESTQKLCRLVYSLTTCQDAAKMHETLTVVQDEMTKLNSVMDEFSSNMEPSEVEPYNAFKDIYENDIVTNFNSLAFVTDPTALTQYLIASGDGLANICTKAETALDALTAVEDELAAESIARMESTYNTARNMSVLFFALSIVMLVASIMICNTMIVKPLSKANQQFSEIGQLIAEGNGDLTLRVENKSNDEVGQLVNGINNFIEILQNVMGNIISSSTKLDGIVATVSSSIDTSNGSVQDVSAALEELSATMEEISATLHSVNESTSAVGDEIDSISNTTAELNSYSEEMLKRADDMSTTAAENKQNTSAMIGNIVDSLKVAIEDSKSVDRVNDLTNDILSISSQTNLLALNASIEAARAGEAGKGFAVVADEIRELAESSKDTANNIQAINEQVIQAVKALTNNSNEIITYIEENILPDYDNFVASGDQYKNDASHVREAMEEFAAQTDQLNGLVHNIIDSIAGISQGVEEGANAVAASAENTASLVDEMQNIDSEMGSNRDVVASLKSDTEVFKKY